MRVIWTVYFVLITALFLLVEFPREDVARYYLARLNKQTGLDLEWQQGVFGFRTAHLANATVVSGGQALLDLDTVDAAFGFDGVDFTLARGGGSAHGLYGGNGVTMQLVDFPLPPMPGGWIEHLTISSDDLHLALPDMNGAGKVEVHADAGPTLASLPAGLSVQGKLQANGEFSLRRGNLELHAGVVGDKTHGHLDLMATRMAPTWLLTGTVGMELNGQTKTWHISGTAASPQFLDAGTPQQFNAAPAPGAWSGRQ